MFWDRSSASPSLVPSDPDVSHLLASVLSRMLLKRQTTVRKLVKVQLAAVLMLLKVQCSSNRPSPLFTANHGILHLALIWTADARRYGARRGASGRGYMSGVAAGIV